MPKKPEESNLEAIFEPAAEQALKDLGLDPQKNKLLWNDIYRHAYNGIVGSALMASDSFDEYFQTVEKRVASGKDISFDALKMQIAARLELETKNSNFTDGGFNFEAGNARHAVIHAAGKPLVQYLRVYKAVYEALEKLLEQTWELNPEARINAWNHYANNAALSPLFASQLPEPLANLQQTFNSLPEPSGDTPSKEDIQDHMLQLHNTQGTRVKARAGEEARFLEIGVYIKQSLDKIAFRAAINELKTIQNERSGGQSPQ